MEMMRTLLGIAIFLLLFRMLEYMAFHYDIGVLMVRTEGREGCAALGSGGRSHYGMGGG